MIQRAKQYYEFGPYRIDAAERQLMRDGEVVPLTPKVFDTLLVLVENSGHILTKDEVMKMVWPEATVEEGNLTRNISTLRKALGENPDEHQYIETIPWRGYRFVASVRVVGNDAAELIVEEHSRARVVIEQEQETRPVAIKRSLWVGKINQHKQWVFVVLAALVTATAIVFFTLNRKPALAERDAILLVDFANTTGEQVFDGALKQALAAQLEQSPFLNIFSDERTRETLRYMGRSPDERVTTDLAYEICRRQGIKAMLAGSIASLGSHYVIGLEAINAQTGDVIARVQVEADSKEKVIATLGKASTVLREKLGESLASIQKFDTPIEQATTPSLEALKAYSIGLEQMYRGKHLEAIPFYKRAIELDSDFAVAYARLSAVLTNSGQPETAIEFAKKAFELRERVSEREKFIISRRYYQDVTGELHKDIETLELWKRTYPRDQAAYVNLSNRYGSSGQVEKAMEEAREGIRLDPTAGPALYNYLARGLMILNRFDEARAVFEQAEAQGIELHVGSRENFYALAFAQGDQATMKQQIDWATGKPVEHQSLLWQANTAKFSGQLRKGGEFSGRAFDLAMSRNLKEVAAQSLADGARMEAVFGDCRASRENAAKALSIARSYPTAMLAAMALALCGEVGQAQSLADELAEKHPKHTLINAVWLPVIRAAIEIHRGSPDKAIQLLLTTSQYERVLFFWPNYIRGQAYLRQHAAAEAMAEFQKIIDHRGWGAASPLYPMAYLGLARAASLSGDIDKSRKAYDGFFALWREADQDAPILQEARRDYEKLK